MMKKLFTLLVLIGICHETKAQNIGSVDYSVNNNEFYVSFIVSNLESTPKYSYDFCLKIIRKDSPEIIPAKTITGNIFNISQNGKYLIIWDVLKDVEYLEGEYKVEVSLCNKKPISDPFRFEEKSKVSNKSSKLGYSFPLVLIGISGAAKLLSQSNYSKYLSATSQVQMDKYYNSANLLNKTFVVTAGVGLLWTTVKLISHKKPNLVTSNKLKFKQSGIVYTLK
jgi:hypothetical protein